MKENTVPKVQMGEGTISPKVAKHIKKKSSPKLDRK